MRNTEIHHIYLFVLHHNDDKSVDLQEKGNNAYKRKMLKHHAILNTPNEFHSYLSCDNSKRSSISIQWNNFMFYIFNMITSSKSWYDLQVDHDPWIDEKVCRKPQHSDSLSQSSLCQYCQAHLTFSSRQNTLQRLIQSTDFQTKANI